jgi:hypothetical protein
MVSLALFANMMRPTTKTLSATDAPTATPLPTDTPTPLPTTTPIPNKNATSSAITSLYPSQVLNLTNWKQTLPIGSSEKPTEVKQPVLATYKLDPWFVVQPGIRAVRFRAPVNAPTTSGSNYPRSELREMTNNGRTNAAWSSTTGTHTMILDQAITAVPTTKRHVVAGQIHDSEDDIIVIRLEYPKLYVNVDGDNVITLDENYTLGKRFTIKFVAHNGKTDVYYNNSKTPSYTLSKDYTGAYFKSGAYTQSNCEREKSVSLCTNQNYGEVLIYNLTVTHQ